ncbi:TIGR03756 family integrating conjugative element protein [Pseudomonas aeruginosa]|nr:TIGR03756 family integrating conjugative element protein [Pseudomonas aeruginosa]
MTRPPTTRPRTASAASRKADVIGHPGGATFSRFASASGYVCPGATFPLVPYFLQHTGRHWLAAWHSRAGVPRSVGPRAARGGWNLLRRHVGNLYPRSGFLHQTDDYKTAAVIAQRAGDITTRIGQLHVYLPMRAAPKDGYWPAGELKEGDASTGKWQELTPSLSLNCAVFPNSGPKTQAVDGDYAWALWRPYSCCQRKGQIFLGSTDFQ